MSKLNRSLVLILLVFLLVGIPSIRAEWVDNGVPVYLSGPFDLGSGNDTTPRNISIVEDGSGGAIIIWQCKYTGDDIDSIYTQRIDSQGNIQWTENGRRVSAVQERQEEPVIMADGSGGAFIFWIDLRNYVTLPDGVDTYGQRIDSGGNTLWSTNDLPVFVSSSRSEVPGSVVPDGSGGVIVIASDCYEKLILAQRIDSGGNALWPVNGVTVHTLTPTAQWGPWVEGAAIDGSGGAIVVIGESFDEINKDYDILTQRIDADGNVVWAAGGVSICNEPYRQDNVCIVSDGSGGAIIAWEDLRSGPPSWTYDIYAQRVNASGTPLWTANGKPVCAVSGDQNNLGMVSDGSGGAILVWRDSRSGANIYAQRIDGNGDEMWTSSGEPVCTASGTQEQPSITSDGAGGAVIAWTDARNGKDIYAQRLDQNGNSLWSADGMVVCDAVEDQKEPKIVTDGSAGGIILWTDHRHYCVDPPPDLYMYPDIYIQTISDDGIPGFPCPYISGISDVPDDQGGSISVSWSASVLDESPFEMITHYSLWRLLEGQEASAVLSSDVKNLALDGMMAFQIDETTCRIIEEGSGTEVWEWITDVPARRVGEYAYTVASLYDSMSTDPHWQYFVVSAETDDPFVFWDSPVDSGYSVDNLSPVPPVALSAEQSFDPEGLTLIWDENSETDFLQYNVYRGFSDDFTPGPGNLIDSPYDPVYFDDEWRWDSGFYYKITSVDVHGNESAFVLAGPGEVTGDDPMPLPDATFLSQNFPNPFNPVTTIGFGLKESGYVSLRIYDAAGRLVTILVDESRPAVSYSTEWNGRSSDGAFVSSGVYFYRLRTGEFVETRKMILLR